MCTVSFVPTQNGFVLTSNRDEKSARRKAFVPKNYDEGRFTLLYPEDPLYGGTWIAAKNNGSAAVLLNGAFEKHKPKSRYQKSRGQIFLEFVRSDDPAGYWQQFSLDDIEPFTLVVFIHERLIEFRWDGVQKHAKYLDVQNAYLWSSATLYDADARSERERWFREWQRTQSIKNRETILDFHLNAGEGDLFNGLVIDRDGIMKTQSITQMELKGDRLQMNYLDLDTRLTTTQTLDISPSTRRRSLHVRLASWRWNSFITRLTHWEYWPFGVVYGAVILYWLWLSVRARSFFFFNAANPSIKNGGLVLARKNEIYDLIPEAYIPKTVLIERGKDLPFINECLLKEGIEFPMIAKPDIGMRGIGVQLLRNTSELEQYATTSRVDFLLQAFIPYPNEVGIFYYRMPDERRGKISGIVGKEFLSVTGDGRSSVGELLLSKPRHSLQYFTIRKNDPGLLVKVPGKGKIVQIVPYGNHARGAKFLDFSHLVDDIVTNRIDDICRQIPGFYFGRLDIRYNSWEEFRVGENFAIIELNGVGSEPAHIYDPSHNILFSWREIIRHWRILGRISRKNHRLNNAPYLSFQKGLRLLIENRKYMKLLSS